MRQVVRHPRADLYELMYTPLDYSVKAGKKVAVYDADGGGDHVHVSVNKGVVLTVTKEQP